MFKQAIIFIGALTGASVCHATVLGFGQLGGSNTPIPKDYGSRATADDNGLVVSNGSTPNIEITWDANGEQNSGSGNGWDIHASSFFQTIEDTTVGGGFWDDNDGTRRVGQLDFGLHTIGFATDPGAQLVLNSFDFGHTAETAGTTMWDLTLTDSASNVAWSQSITFTNGMVETVIPAFTGLTGEDYLLTFERTSETYGSDGRHAIDNLSFNQIPDLSESIGSLIINRSGSNAGTASILAAQSFSFSDYEIRSASESLNPDGWVSIAESGADPLDDWSIADESTTMIGEEDGPNGPNDGLSLAPGGEYELGQVFEILPTFQRDGATPTGWEDASFTLNGPDGALLAVSPQYVGTPVSFGDYNGDGAVNAQDFPQFRAGFGGDYSDLSASQAYLRGDLDGDFDSDIHDYALFVELAGGLSVLAIPEPTTAALIAIGLLAVGAGRRTGNLACFLLFATMLGVGSAANAQTLQGFGVVGSTPVTSIPNGQLSENENAGPDNFFDDTILDETGQIAFDLFSTNYVDPELFPGGFLGQYAIGGETPGVADTAVVFFDYGSSVTADWFAYAQRTGGNPVADKVGAFEFWFSDTDFAGTLPANSPDAVVNLLPGDNRIDDSVIRPYSLGGEHTGRYVALRITETDASGALTGTSRIGGHEFRLLDGPSDVVLTVDRSTGELSLRNNLAGAEDIFMNGFTIESPGGALLSTEFDGIGGDASFPLGNGTGNGWELAGANNVNRVGEAFFSGQSTFAASMGPISLGQAYNSLLGAEDLVFLWTNNQGEVYNARVEYVGVATGFAGDYNDDGQVDAADYTVWRDNNNTSTTLPGDITPGTVTDQDYLVWRDNFGASAPATAFGIPEPHSVALLAISALLATRPVRNALRSGHKA